MSQEATCIYCGLSNNGAHEPWCPTANDVKLPPEAEIRPEFFWRDDPDVTVDVERGLHESGPSREAERCKVDASCYKGCYHKNKEGCAVHW